MQLAAVALAKLFAFEDILEPYAVQDPRNLFGLSAAMRRNPLLLDLLLQAMIRHPEKALVKPLWAELRAEDRARQTMHRKRCICCAANTRRRPPAAEAPPRRCAYRLLLLLLSEKVANQLIKAALMATIPSWPSACGSSSCAARLCHQQRAHDGNLRSHSRRLSSQGCQPHGRNRSNAHRPSRSTTRSNCACHPIIGGGGEGGSG